MCNKAGLCFLSFKPSLIVILNHYIPNRWSNFNERHALLQRQEPSCIPIYLCQQSSIISQAAPKSQEVILYRCYRDVYDHVLRHFADQRQRNRVYESTYVEKGLDGFRKSYFSRQLYSLPSFSAVCYYLADNTLSLFVSYAGCAVFSPRFAFRGVG